MEATVLQHLQQFLAFTGQYGGLTRYLSPCPLENPDLLN
jgi:hypothetical protein